MNIRNRRILAAALALLLLPATALALTGQSISAYQTYYKENVTYLNDIAGRHMLPKDLSVLELDEGGRTQYAYTDSILQVTLTADEAGIIETCEIRLLYPEGAVEGNSLYMDYVAASYQSIAFLMAMHVSAEASGRFLLADEIKTEMAKNNGAYDRQLGSYSISCVKVVGQGAVFTFTNNGLAPAQTQAPADGEEPPAVTEGDEGANVG